METSDQNFDLSLLIEIADGSDEFLIESIDMFLLQTPELMGIIGAAIQAQDRTTLATAAHKLKPNLGFFGMLTGQQLMQEIETLTKNGADFSEIQAKYNQVAAMVNPTIGKLSAIKDEKAANI